MAEAASHLAQFKEYMEIATGNLMQGNKMLADAMAEDAIDGAKRALRIVFEQSKKELDYSECCMVSELRGNDIPGRDAADLFNIDLDCTCHYCLERDGDLERCDCGCNDEIADEEPDDPEGEDDDES